MSWRARVLGALAGVAGVAAAGTTVAVVRQQRIIARRDAGDAVALGSLHSPPITVVADDGTPLHVEVDEPDAGYDTRALTVVFVHGYALNLDCWHFQRAAYRGLVRTVYYDQRSHGRSGRSPRENATIDQLGRDLERVLAEVVPEGPVVLVGHSMGGMSVIALAEQRPDLFGERVVGVGLVSTTAGGLDPSKILLPALPGTLGGQLAVRVMSALSRGHRAVDGLRRVGRGLVRVVTDQMAYGDEVPRSYLDFLDQMLSATPFEVLAEFFPDFTRLDKFAVLAALETVPTTIICGTADRLTPIGHSRKLHAMIDGSTLRECDGAGHMVIIERHVEVNATLDQLLAAAVGA